MKFAPFASLIASALAVPAELAPRTASSVCPSGLYSYPLCCAAIVLGAIGLDCRPPNQVPHDGSGFGKICATKGKQAACCVAPVAEQGILCQTPVGA
ncbi:hypothetical protein MY3296_003078 [Beauveria thailandica]